MKTKFLGVAATLALFAVVSPASANVNLLTNGGFDDVSTTDAGAGLSFPFVNAPSYAYPGGPGGLSTVGSWTYVDGPILQNGFPDGAGGLVQQPPQNNPFFGGPPPLSGNQYAFLQDQGMLSQTFNSSSAGITTIAWYDAGRQNNGGDQSYQVFLNQSLLGTFSTVGSQPFTLESALGSLIVGSNTLSFVGLATNSDQTAFLENVSVSAVPEISTWAMMLLGFGVLGWISYKRRQAPAGASLIS